MAQIKLNEEQLKSLIAKNIKKQLKENCEKEEDPLELNHPNLNWCNLIQIVHNYMFFYKVRLFIVYSNFENNGFNESKNMKKNTIKLDENRLQSIVAESIKKIVKEGMLPDNPYFDYWKQVEEQLGAEQMLNDIFQYLSSSMLEQIVRWFDEDYDFGFFDSEEDGNEDDEEDYA